MNKILTCLGFIFVLRLLTSDLNGNMSGYDKQCESNQLAIWDGARSYMLEHGLLPTHRISPKLLEKEYVKTPEMISCPVSHIEYDAFFVTNGPVCKSGHQIDTERRKTIQNDMIMIFKKAAFRETEGSEKPKK